MFNLLYDAVLVQLLADSASHTMSAVVQDVQTTLVGEHHLKQINRHDNHYNHIKIVKFIEGASCLFLKNTRKSAKTRVMAICEPRISTAV